MSCAEDLSQEPGRKWVVALAANVPRGPQDTQAQVAQLLVARLSAKTHQRGGDLARHVPRQLEGVPLGSPDDAPGAELGGNDVEDAHWGGKVLWTVGRLDGW